MAVKDLLREVEEDVVDVLNTDFKYFITKNVPNSDDSGLTFERSVEKKGKVIETCVLFADIRNSVSLNKKHHTQTMGRIYTSFAKSVLKAAEHHNGFVRDIIGDRVFVVFPSEECFTNAVNCAISINHISSKIIRKKFTNISFECGIGIAHGKLRAIKVGIPKRGTERTDNKNLVWVGYPANIASRLTDVANKTYEEEYYEVKKNPINPKRQQFSIVRILGNLEYDPDAPLYLSTVKKAELSIEEFADSIRQLDTGKLYMTGGNLLEFVKKNRKYSFQPILMTDEVYQGFKKANPNREKSITEDLWTEQLHKIDNVESTVFGGDIYWSIK